MDKEEWVTGGRLYKRLCDLAATERVYIWLLSVKKMIVKEKRFNDEGILSNSEEQKQSCPYDSRSWGLARNAAEEKSGFEICRKVCGKGGRQRLSLIKEKRDSTRVRTLQDGGNRTLTFSSRTGGRSRGSPLSPDSDEMGI